jgi:SAM-dependent methyltransferase
MQVNMGDWWFDVANNKHFWIVRRFDAMRRLADSVIRNSSSVGEIGCGNGLLQRAIEDYYHKPVTGFDLNEFALQQNVSRISQLYCYDIHQRNPQFQARFDLLLLFDVLEHIEDESGFLQSVKFHLAEAGIVIINVPAHQFLYSDYDRAAGHIRRYSVDQLTKVAKQNGLRVLVATYWGMPLIPLLLFRRLMKLDRNNARVGFDARGPFMNFLLSWLARCEPLPHRTTGTSVMAVVEKQ